jgi:hypothetical protein
VAGRPPHRPGRTAAAAGTTTTRVKKTNRSTLSLSVGGVIRRLPVAGPHHERLLTAASCDNLILYPGVSRARDRRERGRWKHKRKGSNAALFCNKIFLLSII